MTTLLRLLLFTLVAVPHTEAYNIHSSLTVPSASVESRRRLLRGLTWTGVSLLEICQGKCAAIAAEEKLKVELVQKGGGPPVKDGDYVFVDFKGWLDGFDGAELMDSSNANGGQTVKVVIGAGDVGGQGLLAGEGKGGTVAKPVSVRIPLGVNDVLTQGAAPRNPDGTLATQASTAAYPDAATIGTRFRIVIPQERGFGKEGGVSGAGFKVPPGATLYYEVRIRGKTGKFQTGV
mmetsp:Transcript_22226/g.30314  ORF Transcript_22226/g.30314 Transcript_22226/m.30314 type:complete len:234 (-) Transcript_22226:62-763(-)|eukprot:CAMPEP_0185770980 /NCGR_PEP_ID=MMETSP1174-20130828/62478_1 /TAXON_ID=35687 /ORGANISM="Dictyocha speculum, Strain CCMP1381" /LENGTH=233 /DNA_ID=CAMNT_0028456665 /DNA_START=45 /DNA_END=746 /DNA_ORIENTATION=-